MDDADTPYHLSTAFLGIAVCCQCLRTKVLFGTEGDASQVMFQLKHPKKDS